MPEYESYMKAFGSDLKTIAVWEPGEKRELGDFGEVRNKQWQSLGSIWDFLGEEYSNLKNESESSSLIHKGLGSAEVLQVNANANYGGLAGNLSVGIRFGKKHSVFVRAYMCRTRSLKKLQALSEALVTTGKWKERWSFVNEVQEAQKFLVLVCSENSGEIHVNAKSDELLGKFIDGTIDSEADIQIQGSTILKFIGRNGPICMKLSKLSGPGLLMQDTRVKQVKFAEGKGNLSNIYVEDIKPEEIINNL